MGLKELTSIHVFLKPSLTNTCSVFSSVDLSWYTNRIGLSAVYKSTELFMLSDNSPEKHQTWEFLSRRLSDMDSVNYTARVVAKDFPHLACGVVESVQSMFGVWPGDQARRPSGVHKS